MASSSPSAGGSGAHRRSRKATGYWLWYKKTLNECGGNENVAAEMANTTWTSLSQEGKDGWNRRAREIRAANVDLMGDSCIISPSMKFEFELKFEHITVLHAT